MVETLDSLATLELDDGKPGILEEAINNHPLTPEIVDRFLNSHLNRVYFLQIPGRRGFHSPAKDFYFGTNRPWHWDLVVKFNIFIDPKEDVEDARITSPHEILHILFGYYEVKSWEEEGLSMPEADFLIEREAQRFYRQNTDFSANRFNRFYGNDANFSLSMLQSYKHFLTRTRYMRQQSPQNQSPDFIDYLHPFPLPSPL